MKRLILTICCVGVAIVLFRFTFHKASGPPLGIADAQKLQLYWSKSPAAQIPSSELQRTLESAINLQGDDLDQAQKRALLESVNSWLNALHTGSLESFISFRKPQGYEFDDEQLHFVASRHHIDESSLAKMSDQEKVKMLFDHFTRITFDSIPETSILIQTSESFPKTGVNPSSGKKPFRYYPRPMLELHPPTPFRYVNTPNVIIHKYGKVQWASLSAAFQSKHWKDEAIPLQIAFYWSPAESQWKPAECYMTIPDKHREKGKPDPTVLF